MYQHIFYTWKYEDDNYAEENNVTINGYYFRSNGTKIDKAHTHQINDLLDFCNFLLDKKEFDQTIRNIHMHIDFNDYVENYTLMQSMRTFLNRLCNLIIDVTLNDHNIQIVLWKNHSMYLIFYFSFMYFETVNKDGILIDIFSEIFNKVSYSKFKIMSFTNVHLISKISCEHNSNNKIIIDRWDKNCYQLLTMLGSSVSTLKFGYNNSYSLLNQIKLPSLTSFSCFLTGKTVITDVLQFIQLHTTITSLNLASLDQNIYRNQILENVYTNTHIQKLKLENVTDVKSVKNLLANNTTLRKLSIDVKRNWYYVRGYVVKIKSIQPNFEKLDIGYTITDINAIIASNCKKVTVHKCIIDSAYIDQKMEEHPENLALCTLLHNLSTSTDLQLKKSNRVLKKHATLKKIIKYGHCYHN